MKEYVKSLGWSEKMLAGALGVNAVLLTVVLSFVVDMRSDIKTSVNTNAANLYVLSGEVATLREKVTSNTLALSSLATVSSDATKDRYTSRDAKMDWEYHIQNYHKSR